MIRFIADMLSSWRHYKWRLYRFVRILRIRLSIYYGGWMLYRFISRGDGVHQGFNFHYIDGMLAGWWHFAINRLLYRGYFIAWLRRSWYASCSKYFIATIAPPCAVVSYADYLWHLDDFGAWRGKGSILRVKPIIKKYDIFMKTAVSAASKRHYNVIETSNIWCCFSKPYSTFRHFNIRAAWSRSFI